MWPSDSDIRAMSVLHLELAMMRRDVQRWWRNIGGNIGWSGVSPNIARLRTRHLHLNSELNTLPLNSSALGCNRLSAFSCAGLFMLIYSSTHVGAISKTTTSVFCCFCGVWLFHSFSGANLSWLWLIKTVSAMLKAYIGLQRMIWMNLKSLVEIVNTNQKH